MSSWRTRLHAGTRRPGALVGLLALTLALAGKLAYGRATPSDLRWVLEPSCFIAERLGRLHFVWDPASGFVSHGTHLVVGPPCAGLNFIVACALALYFSTQTGFADVRGKLFACAASFGAAYVTTVFANGARIALAVRLGHADFHSGVASEASVHRLIGVLVYATVLLGLCAAASRWVGVRAPRPRESAARAVGIPVACYLGVALAIPFCHRMLGHGAPPLAEHAAQTSTAVAFLAAVAVLGRRPLDRLFSRRARLCARS